jgi:hypothetical protein
MRAILSVTSREGYTLTNAEEPRILYHSRTGLTPDRSKATRFKTLNHAVKVARKRYSPRLAYWNAPEGTYLSRDLQSWNAQTIEENKS